MVGLNLINVALCGPRMYHIFIKNKNHLKTKFFENKFVDEVMDQEWTTGRIKKCTYLAMTKRISVGVN